MKNFLVGFLSFLLIVSLLPVSSVKAYDLPSGLDRTDEVTFGVFDHTSGALVESDPVELGNYFLTGLSKGLYEAYYTEFTAGGVDQQFLYDYFYNSNSWQWLRNAAYNGWLINCVIDVNNLYFFGIRIPSINGHPSFNFGSGSLADTYTWTVEPDNGTCVFLIDSFDDDVMVGFCPEFNSMENWSSNVLTVQVSGPSLVNYSYLTDPDLRGFFVVVNKPTVFDSSFSLNISEYLYPYYYAPSSGWQCMKSVQAGRYYLNLFHSLDKIVFSTFPFFDTALLRAVNISAFSEEYMVNIDFPPTSVYFSTSSLTNIYLSEYNTVTPDPDWTPGPWITPTPIVVSPVPTAAPGPSGVDPMDGLGQMFNGILARSYTFEYNGIEFEINPLFFFLGCVFIGLTFRIFVGGTHE